MCLNVEVWDNFPWAVFKHQMDVAKDRWFYSLILFFRY